MKKKYITPEVEMIKFIETEEMMAASIESIPGLTGEYGVGDILGDWQ